MPSVCVDRTIELQRRMSDEGIDLFVVTDVDSVYYLSGFWGHLGLEFDRATIVVVPSTGEPTLITPAMEAEMGRAMSWIAEVREWTDGIDGEWKRPLADLVSHPASRVIAVEAHKTDPRILDVLRREAKESSIKDGAAILSNMRMIKSPDEIAVMRQGRKDRRRNVPGWPRGNCRGRAGIRAGAGRDRRGNAQGGGVSRR